MTETTLRLGPLTLHRAGRELLNLAPLRASGGEFIAIIGPNGAGKSTLLKSLTGEWPVTGDIELLGQALSDWHRPALARRMAVMAQNSQLNFDFRVREVVALGRLPHRGESAKAAESAVASALAALNLQSFENRRFTSLSGGERQRVQFARVLAQIQTTRSARLLLLDEPTSALDLAQQKLVLDLALSQSRLGATVIAVMHDLNMASRYADRIWVLNKGRLVLDATPTQVMQREVVEEVFGLAVSTELSAIDSKPIVLLKPSVNH